MSDRLVMFSVQGESRTGRSWTAAPYYRAVNMQTVMARSK